MGFAFCFEGFFCFVLFAFSTFQILSESIYPFIIPGRNELFGFRL